VSHYPDAASVYSRLADAYLAKGAKDLAIENYKKALALDPKMASAKDALKKLN
jgi:Tfp pilus assembly protein PilF